MPVDCRAIRDASLTTLFNRQRALAAFRNNNPQGFPVGNAYVPEQFRNTFSAEVPLNAKQGACRLGCNPDYNELINGYGFQPPSNVANNTK